MRHSVRLFSALATLTTLLSSALAQAQATPQQLSRPIEFPSQVEIEAPAVIPNLAQREQRASPEIRSRLGTMRQQIQAEKLNFTVGYTSALDRDLAQAVAPKSDDAAKRAQNEAAAAILKAEGTPSIESILKLRDAAGTSSTQSTRCSARRSLVYSGDDVSAIRDQKHCGSCWAFAAAGITESSYRIRYSRHADVSEQELVDCAGGLLNGLIDGCKPFYAEDALEHMKYDGVAWESRDPYQAHDLGTCENPPYSYKLSNWGWVTDTSVEQLKAALCQYGPLATTLQATSLFHGYTGGVFSEYGASHSAKPNHVLVIVGWDDTRQAWRVRNSWGVDWGEAGYGWVKYNHNGIGQHTLWAVAKRT